MSDRDLPPWPGRRRKSGADVVPFSPPPAPPRPLTFAESVFRGLGRLHRRERGIDSFGFVAVIGVLSVAALIAVLVLGHASRSDEVAVPNSAWVPGPPLPLAPLIPASVRPAPTSGTTAPFTVTPPGGRPADPTGAARPTTKPRVTTTATKAPTTTPPPLQLTPGATISLEIAAAPGYLVRHRNAATRIDAIGPGSAAADRANASFTVRAGLADAGCFSFESVDSPRQYLRHRNYVLFLNPVDFSSLYRADATFCPTAGRLDGTLLLRSRNYPDRFLNVRNQQIFLDSVPDTAATAFRVRPAP